MSFRRSSVGPALALLLLAVGGPGCSSGGAFRLVEFEAPPQPGLDLRPLLADVERMGVLTLTNVQPMRELDIEKVMGKLADGTARALRNLSDVTVVSQDEIRWHFNYASLDSLGLANVETRRVLRDELELDALVLLELKRVQATVTPMSPMGYGMTSTPGLDISVNLQTSLTNLHSNEVWRPSDAAADQRNWQPIQMQLFVDGQTERQLLLTLSRPLQQFLAQVAPLPRRQVRHFEISSD